MLVVDAANVVGSRPDGWWRDRAGAAAGLVHAVRVAVADGRVGAPVVVVLEGAARGGAKEGDEDGVRVVHAPGEGDETIAAAASAAPAGVVTVVSADRALAARVRAVGAGVVGPRWLLDRLSP
ncbi:MAG TPA: hypothetical protein VM242_03560 [Acidimicrobiales bacterium]|nr:hypothetical protein [Acidimicrobiales bacterium]